LLAVHRAKLCGEEIVTGAERPFHQPALHLDVLSPIVLVHERAVRGAYLVIVGVLDVVALVLVFELPDSLAGFRWAHLLTSVFTWTTVPGSLPALPLRSRRSRTVIEVLADDHHGAAGVARDALGDAAHHKALHPAADNWLNLTRIELRVYVDNSGAVALYKKFGFEIEGTHRRLVFRNGEYVDAYSMARIR
jgi:GNAT superfamily N-acetyltransferase